MDLKEGATQPSHDMAGCRREEEREKEKVASLKAYQDRLAFGYRVSSKAHVSNVENNYHFIGSVA